MCRQYRVGCQATSRVGEDGDFEEGLWPGWVEYAGKPCLKRSWGTQLPRRNFKAAATAKSLSSTAGCWPKAARTTSARWLQVAAQGILSRIRVHCSSFLVSVVPMQGVNKAGTDSPVKHGVLDGDAVVVVGNEGSDIVEQAAGEEGIHSFTMLQWDACSTCRAGHPHRDG